MTDPGRYLLACLALSGGDAPLPFEAFEIETGRRIETFSEYADTATGPICTFDPVEIVEPDPIAGGGWILVLVIPDPTGVDPLPPAPPPDPIRGACGPLFSWGRR